MRPRHELAEALSRLAAARTEAEAAAAAQRGRTCRGLAAAARGGGAVRGRAGARFKIEQETFEKEAERLAQRQSELTGRMEQLTRDLARESELVAEAHDILSRLERRGCCAAHARCRGRRGRDARA